MILNHYSHRTFLDPRSVDVVLGASRIGPFGKPDGLWLSDDRDFGWKEWATQQNYTLGKNVFAVQVRRRAIILDAAYEVDRLRDALQKCADELETSYRDWFEGVWTEDDFERGLASYTRALGRNKETEE